jgi:serine/threonine protein kinase
VVKPILFGKFCLLERVSVGGMAEVFRAKPMDSPGFEKFLAIKRILPNLAEDDEFIEMFIDEAKIAVQLNHRNICQIYELGRLHDSHYIVMEFISGRDILAIQNRLRRERRIMSVGQAAYLCRQIASGLDYAHRKLGDDGTPLGIIHRDVSPQNVLVSYTGEVKVIDFGIAKAATKSNKTQVGVLKGKFGYMSPEQVRGLPLDRRSDIFALGTLFHEMLTCRRLFHGESDFSTLEKVRRADAPPPSKLNPNIPPEIDRIVARSLAADPDERYQWCQELADDLDNFLTRLRPPYTERTLEDWMQRMFEAEMTQERQKRQAFAQFQTSQDVELFNEKLRQELSAKMGLPETFDGKDKDQISAQSTQIWDSSKALPGADMEPTEEATMQDSPEIMQAAHTMIVENFNPNAPIPLRPPPPVNLAKAPVAYIPPSMAHLYEPPPPTGPGKLGIALVILLIFGTLSIIGVAAYLFFFTNVVETAPDTGSLTILTDPVQDVEILLNGKIVATRTPHQGDQLPPGSYTLEVRHPDFLPIARRVDINAGRTTDLNLQLKPRPVGLATLSLRVDPPDAEVYIDGKPDSATGPARTISIDDRRAHLIEARAPGHFVAETRLEATDGQKLSKTLKLRRLEGSVDIKSTPPGATIYLNGVKAGKAPQILEHLDARQTFELELRSPGYALWKKTVVFDRSHQKTFQVNLKPKSDTSTDEEETFGYVTAIADKTWWKVYINGWDSGLTTPLTAKQRLTLPVGEHTLSFVRGDTRHDEKIVVEEGRTLSLENTHDFTW